MLSVRCKTQGGALQPLVAKMSITNNYPDLLILLSLRASVLNVVPHKKVWD